MWEHMDRHTCVDATVGRQQSESSLWKSSMSSGD